MGNANANALNEMGKIIPMQSVQLHPADEAQSKLVGVHATQTGGIVTIVAMAVNGSSLDDVLDEVAVIIQARKAYAVMHRGQ